ncbi:unnamed protein product [Cercospora beticola]|nr:unnamed protein product [Cercospora beticola]
MPQLVEKQREGKFQDWLLQLSFYFVFLSNQHACISEARSRRLKERRAKSSAAAFDDHHFLHMANVVWITFAVSPACTSGIEMEMRKMYPECSLTPLISFLA